MTAGHLILDDGESSYDRRGEGPPVVPLHGGGLGRVTWDRRSASPAHDHTVIRYDARGHGGSSPVTGPFAQHEDPKGLLDGLGRSGPHEVDRAPLRLLSASR